MPTIARLATVTTIEITSAMLRQRMKSRFVLSGTSFRSFIDASDMQNAGTLSLHPNGDEHPREIDGREHRGDDADHKDDGETADRPGTEVPHQHGGDDVGDVRVDDRRRGFLVARLDRIEALPPASLLLADAL